MTGEEAFFAAFLLLVTRRLLLSSWAAAPAHRHASCGTGSTVRSGFPLAGKPDRTVEPVPQEAWRCAGAAAQEDRSKRRVTRSKKAAKKASSPVIDPYLPANGNFGYRVSRYELELEYKVTINRLSGAATITAVTLTALQTFTLDLSHALSVTKVSVNGKRPAHFRLSLGKLRIALQEALPAGAAMTIAVRYGGTPRPIHSYWGEVGFEELTNGVLVAGQPNGAASWFPCDDHPKI